MVDIAHQCSFAYLWGIQPTLQKEGYRTVSSQASLNTVLDPNGKCRIRIPFDTKNKIYPFAWYPNFEYNVVITQQTDASSPSYTPKEQKALVEYVENGGGLVILGSTIKKEEIKDWSMNALARAFGAEFTDVYQQGEYARYATLSLDKNWQVIATSKDGSAIQARREFGKGRVVISGSTSDLVASAPKSMDTESKDKFLKNKSENIDKMIGWVCENQEPVGGEPRLPQTMGGGGAIYPELEGGTDGIVVFYTPNYWCPVTPIPAQLPPSASISDAVFAYFQKSKPLVSIDLKIMSTQ